MCTSRSRGGRRKQIDHERNLLMANDCHHCDCALGRSKLKSVESTAASDEFCSWLAGDATASTKRMLQDMAVAITSAPRLQRIAYCDQYHRLPHLMPMRSDFICRNSGGYLNSHQEHTFQKSFACLTVRKQYSAAYLQVYRMRCAPVFIDWQAPPPNGNVAGCGQ